MKVLLVVLAVIVVTVVATVVASYNRFVRQRTLAEESWRGIDVELTRRHELIPNLVATVQGYAAYERSLLDQLVAAREAATAHGRSAPHERQGYEESLSGALARVLARAEAYPELRASANFLALQRELTNTEDRIAASRRFYNGNVRAYNSRVGTFPSNVIARVFGFNARDFFELTDPAARYTPQVPQS